MGVALGSCCLHARVEAVEGGLVPGRQNHRLGSETITLGECGAQGSGCVEELGPEHKLTLVKGLAVEVLERDEVVADHRGDRGIHLVSDEGSQC